MLARRGPLDGRSGTDSLIQNTSVMYARSQASAITSTRLPYVWDYDLDENQVRRLLFGALTIGRLNRTSAAVRLLEYAPYLETVRLTGFRQFVRGWPEWRSRIRSESCKRGFEVLAAWLPEHHRELV